MFSKRLSCSSSTACIGLPSLSRFRVCDSTEVMLTTRRNFLFAGKNIKFINTKLRPLRRECCCFPTALAAVSLLASLLLARSIETRKARTIGHVRCMAMPREWCVRVCVCMRLDRWSRRVSPFAPTYSDVGQCSCNIATHSLLVHRPPLCSYLALILLR